MNTFSQAQTYLDTLIRQGMARYGTPAVTVAWTDREKLLYVGVWGFADPESRTALTPDHLFNFGSIGKSFTCIALLNAQENGLLDLSAPVTQYLPWFSVQTQHRPITLHDLMTHSSGLPQGTDQETEALGEVWNLRHLHTGFPPGDAFYYSNSGYKTLGLVLEKVYGMPYPQIIRQQILDPLGMVNTEPALTHASRPRFARSYMPLFDDRPRRLDSPLVPMLWIESATADGCLSSNAEDLAIYTRMLLNRGAGKGKRIFSEANFEKMTQPYQQRLEERAYGYGMMMWQEDGCRCIGHSGSIPGYLAFMRLDMDNGLGAVMMMTEPVMEGVSEIALKVLRSAVLGADLPANPFEGSTLLVENPAEYTGRYTDGERSFDIQEDGDLLFLIYHGERYQLEPRGKDAFLVGHPDFEHYLLRFSRQGGAQDPIVEAFYGAEWYRNERYRGRTEFDVPQAWRSFTGHYRSHNPWSTNFRVVIRKDQLVLIHPEGREAQLQALDGGDFLLAYEEEPVHVERLAFDGLADGKAVVARYSGADHYRFFTA